MNNTDIWINDYIKNINIEKIEWIKLNCNELDSFLKNNYFDKKVFKYVCNENDSVYPTLLGMTYINICNTYSNDYNFLLGIVDNNIGKKTIVAAMIYLEKYYMFTNQEKPVTYLSTTEVNYYFRNRGIYKKMCEELVNHINFNQHIITSKQSRIGKKYNIINILRNIMLSNGFKNKILEDNYCLTNKELSETISEKQIILKNNKKKSQSLL